MAAVPDLPFVESAQHRKQQVENTRQLFEAASLLQAVPLGDGRLIRPLYAQEVQTLRGPCHCRCQDWSNLRLLLSAKESNFDQSNLLEQLVSHTTFADLVVIEVTEPGETYPTNAVWEKLPPGVHSNTLICNCIIETNARVYHNRLVSDTHVCASSILMNCGRVSCSGNVLFGEITVTVGAESGGGRDVKVTAESTMIDVCSSLGMAKKTSLPARAHVTSDWNILGLCSIIRDTPTVANVYLAPQSGITAASSVRNATLLPLATIGNVCTVSDVFLQWNSSIVDNSSVSDSLLMEEAHAGPHSLVASTILGPDVHVSAGEIHASVLGPNTNAHHQSLLIGVLWPLGRGNVGYGANVGSNHTGRVPDQEATVGEGTFWGLGAVIKFPVDLSWSPFSVIAAGTILPPQRIVMPFSLIVDGNILPGWVLQNSPYTVSRSEAKFANRRKAERHRFYTGWHIIRPDIVDICILAREWLRSVQTQAAVYNTDKEVKGIGKNQLTEKARLAGIQTYTDCIQLYALRGLLHQLVSGQRSPKQLTEDFKRDLTGSSYNLNKIASKMAKQAYWAPLPWEHYGESEWSHQLCILTREFPDGEDFVSWTTMLLSKLVSLQSNYAKRVRDCKGRDDVRGASIIPAYADSHLAAEKDPLVIASLAEARKIAEKAGEVLAELTNQEKEDNARSRL